MRRLILVLMSNVCYLTVIFIFLVVTWWLLLVTSWLLLVTAGYLVVTAGYCWLLVVTARYRSLLLVPTFTMNAFFNQAVSFLHRFHFPPVTSKFSVDFYLLHKLRILFIIRQPNLFLFVHLVHLSKTTFMGLLKVFTIHCIQSIHNFFFFFLKFLRS